MKIISPNKILLKLIKDLHIKIRNSNKWNSNKWNEINKDIKNEWYQKIVSNTEFINGHKINDTEKVPYYKRIIAGKEKKLMNEMLKFKHKYNL